MCSNFNSLTNISNNIPLGGLDQEDLIQYMTLGKAQQCFLCREPSVAPCISCKIWGCRKHIFVMKGGAYCSKNCIFRTYIHISQENENIAYHPKDINIFINKTIRLVIPEYIFDGIHKEGQVIPIFPSDITTWGRSMTTG